MIPGPAIGRQRETGVLARAIEAPGERRKRVILMRGSLGTGKTTLLAWAHRHAQEAGHLTAFVRAPLSGYVPPRFPTAALLEGLVRACEEKGTSAPDLLSVTVDAMRGGSTQAPDLLQVAQAVEMVAHTAPLSLYVDDVQWISTEGSSFLLAVLAVVDVPLLLVGTVRSDAGRSGPELRLPAPSADLPVEELEVAGLTPEAVAQLAAEILEGPVLPSLATELYERTLGNPLFVVETIRAWRDDGEIVPVAGGYWGAAGGGARPESRSLREMVAARLRDLDAGELAAANALAVLARAGRFEELLRTTELDRGSLVDALADLERSAIVASEGAPAHLFRLAHPLYQSSLLAEMGSTVEGSWHGRIYGALEESNAAAAAELAHHAIRALERPDDLPGLLGRAAEQAEAAGSFVDAASWYGHLAEVAGSDEATLARALEGRSAALEHFDPAAAIDSYGARLALGTTPDHRARLLIGRARAFRKMGSPDRALEDLEEAAAIAAPEDAFSVRHSIGVMHAVRGDTEIAERMLRTLAEESRGTPAHTKIVGHLASVMYVQGRLDEGLELNRAAQAECRDAGFLNALKMFEAWFQAMMGEWDEARRLMDVGLEAARRANDLWNLVSTLANATWLAAWRGDFDRAIDLGADALRLSAQEANPSERIDAVGAMGFALLEKGDVADALALLIEVPVLAAASTEKLLVPPALIALGEAHLAGGDLRRARQCCDEARGLITQNIPWSAALDRLAAQIRLAEGSATEALDIVAGWIEQPANVPFEQARLLEVAAHAHASLRKRPRALELAEQAAGIYERLQSTVRAHRMRDWIAGRAPRQAGRPRSTLPGALTEREVEVLRRVVQGKSNSVIAQELTISRWTVKKHVENILAKAGASRRGELAAFALSLGIPIDPVRR